MVLEATWRIFLRLFYLHCFYMNNFGYARGIMKAELFKHNYWENFAKVPLTIHRCEFVLRVPLPLEIFEQKQVTALRISYLQLLMFSISCLLHEYYKAVLTSE